MTGLLKKALAQTLTIWWRRANGEIIRTRCPMCAYTASHSLCCSSCQVNDICISKERVLYTTPRPDLGRRCLERLTKDAWIVYCRLVQLWKFSGYGPLPKGARPRTSENKVRKG